MTSEPTQHDDADVVIIGFGAAGGGAAIEAHDAGANVVLLEKQPEATHLQRVWAYYRAERRCGSAAGDGVKPSLRSRLHG